MSTGNDPFSLDGRISGKGKMRVNGLTCVLNMPPALVQRFANGVELAQPLPPYNVRPAFKVEDYEACPDTWMRGSSDAASYFVPVRVGQGLWLDFNDNHDHTHEVAVVISVQGVNSISGLEVNDPYLEQYRQNCPKHDKPFGADRFCPECGYMWNPQIYLAGNATPRGMFWLDGFWAEDGVTRQYILSEDELRGIASQVIGDKAVFAIGIAFFLSREPKPKPVRPDRILYRGVNHVVGESKAAYSGMSHWDVKQNQDVKGLLPEQEPVAMAAQMSLNHIEEIDSFGPETTDQETTLEAVIEEKALHIGAGAKIDQPVYRDPQELSFWQEKPAGIIYINYVGVETCKAILAKGKVDRTAGGDGWMHDLKVGNPAQ